MIDPANPAILAILTTFAGEALKTWGSYAIVLIVLGVMHWRAAIREKAKDVKIAALETEIKALNEKRLEDAQRLIRVTEAGTATMASRGQGDQLLASAMAQVAGLMAEMKDSLARMNPPRRSSR